MKSKSCRPRWCRGTVLASRSKVRGFKFDWDRWIFSVRKTPEYKSCGRDFKAGGSESEISGSLKNRKPGKIGLWAKFNRYIHVLVSKFGEHNRSQKGSTALGNNDHPINTIQYKSRRDEIDDLCWGQIPGRPNSNPFHFFYFRTILRYTHSRYSSSQINSNPLSSMRFLLIVLLLIPFVYLFTVLWILLFPPTLDVPFNYHFWILLISHLLVCPNHLNKLSSNTSIILVWTVIWFLFFSFVIFSFLHLLAVLRQNSILQAIIYWSAPYNMILY